MMRRLLFLWILPILSFATPTPIAAHNQADNELESLQAILTAGLQKSGEQQLAEAQRAWERLRDAECRYQQANYSLMTSSADCSKTLTGARVKEFKSKLSGFVELQTA